MVANTLDKVPHHSLQRLPLLEMRRPDVSCAILAFIDSHAAEARNGRPLFLYFPLTAPHDPIEPDDAWRGKSCINAYADFVMQIDDTVGRVVDALKTGRIADNTLIIVTSDNGCSPVADFRTLAAKGHHPSYVFRGCKADVYEGGHRVPFVVRWPGRVKAGAKSDQMICLTDLMATFAEIVGAKLPDNAGEDSVSLLSALLGTAQSQKPLREAIVHHSINGSFAIRQGNWKLALCRDSGGWSAPLPGSREAAGLPDLQLYDLTADLGERKNVYREHPEVVERLTALLEKYVAEGRSTPGAKQANTTPVRIQP
jgi:arylsulfatase A-like enzyme